MTISPCAWNVTLTYDFRPIYYPKAQTSVNLEQSPMAEDRMDTLTFTRAELRDMLLARWYAEPPSSLSLARATLDREIEAEAVRQRIAADRGRPTSPPLLP